MLMEKTNTDLGITYEGMQNKLSSQYNDIEVVESMNRGEFDVKSLNNLLEVAVQFSVCPEIRSQELLNSFSCSQTARLGNKAPCREEYLKIKKEE